MLPFWLWHGAPYITCNLMIFLGLYKSLHLGLHDFPEPVMGTAVVAVGFATGGELVPSLVCGHRSSRTRVSFVASRRERGNPHNS